MEYLMFGGSQLEVFDSVAIYVKHVIWRQQVHEPEAFEDPSLLTYFQTSITIMNGTSQQQKTLSTLISLLCKTSMRQQRSKIAHGDSLQPISSGRCIPLSFRTLDCCCLSFRVLGATFGCG